MLVFAWLHRIFNSCVIRLGVPILHYHDFLQHIISRQKVIPKTSYQVDSSESSPIPRWLDPCIPRSHLPMSALAAQFPIHESSITQSQESAASTETRFRQQTVSLDLKAKAWGVLRAGVQAGPGPVPRPLKPINSQLTRIAALDIHPSHTLSSHLSPSFPSSFPFLYCDEVALSQQDITCFSQPCLLYVRFC